VGGIQTVTLGDEEARRRGTQKSVLERKAPPTFDVVVEIQDWYHVTVHNDVAGVVDAMLLGRPVSAQVRTRDDDGSITMREHAANRGDGAPASHGKLPTGFTGLAAVPPRVSDAQGLQPLRIYPFGVSRPKLEQAAKELRLPVSLVKEPADANLVVTLKPYFRRKPQILRDAEASGTPIYVLKNNTGSQMLSALAGMYNLEPPTTTPAGQDNQAQALQEAEDAINQVMEGGPAIDLNPQNPYVRRLQHRLAERYNLGSRSQGREPLRRVRILPPGLESV
jgi:R3H domain-containing protein